MIKDLLFSGEYTCVLSDGNKIYTSDLRGVRPLVKWYTDKMDFAGFSAADKVVGKATAFLYVLLKVKYVYADVLSVSAKKVFDDNGIETGYSTLVPNIINRKGDGICPFEEAVFHTDNPQKAYEIIIEKMKELNINF